MSGLKHGQRVGFIGQRAGVEIETFPGRGNELDKGQRLERHGGVECGWRERAWGSVWAAEDTGLEDAAHEARGPGGGSDTGGHQTFAMRSVSEPWFPGPLQMAGPLSPRHSWPQGEAAQPAQSTHPHLLGHFSQRSRLSDERASPPRLPLPSRAEIGGRHLHARHQKRWPRKHPGNIDRVSE